MELILAASSSSGNSTGSFFFSIVGYLLWCVAIMGAFRKAGKPAWSAFIPIYNLIVLLEIVGRPVWWFILLLIPCVNIVVYIILMLDVAKSYGQSQGFGVALGVGIIIPIISLICWFILSYGDSKYVGPAAGEASGVA